MLTPEQYKELATKEEVLVGRMVQLDFGPYGSVTVPAGVAMTFVSDQGIKDQLRKECLRGKMAPIKDDYKGTGGGSTHPSLAA